MLRARSGARFPVVNCGPQARGRRVSGLAINASGNRSRQARAVVQAGAVLFVISAAAAWLTAGATALEHSFGRTIIPLGKWFKAVNVPGARATGPIAYPAGMPGVRVGQ